MPRITAEIAGVRLDSTKITDAVSDAIHSTVDAASDMLKPGQPFTIDEAADLSVKPFDSKEVKFLKAQASHWKNEATIRARALSLCRRQVLRLVARPGSKLPRLD